jgi:hypothetical protein
MKVQKKAAALHLRCKTAPKPMPELRKQACRDKRSKQIALTYNTPIAVACFVLFDIIRALKPPIAVTSFQPIAGHIHN